MPIKDLKNTTWLLNDTISVPPLVDSDSIYVSSNGVEGSLGVYTSVPSMEQTLTIGDVTIYNFTSNTWTDEKYRLCTVTGGNLTANAEMISWFQTNGKFNTNAEEVVANMRKSRAVSDALLSSANAKTGKSDANLTDAVKTLLEGYGQGGGGGGECSGKHIIEVDELPTENIDETAIYWDGESYYKAGKGELKDIIYVSSGTVNSVVELYTAFGLTFELYYVKTRPTENIVVTTDTSFACYYVEDENDILMYFSKDGTSEWVSFATVMDSTNQGAITDISEATIDGGCYALVEGGWVNYVAVKGNLDIAESGKYDVSAYASVNVGISSTCMVKTVDELPTDVPDGSMAIVLGGE